MKWRPLNLLFLLPLAAQEPTLLTDSTGAKIDASNITASTWRTALALVPGTDVQAYDADLLALAALTGTNTLYYRSASNTWSAVTIGSGLTFTGGTLAATGGGFDATTIDAVTWSDGANASNVWTFDVSGTDPTITFGDGTITLGADLALGSNDVSGVGTITATTTSATTLSLGGTTITSTGAELNILDGATLAVADLNIIDGISDSGTLTAAELLYVDGVTSGIQAQLNAKAPIDSPTFTTAASAPTPSAGDSDTSVATTAFVTEGKIQKAFIEKHADSHTLSAAECYGGVYYVTAASVTLTLPAAADGMSLTVICNTANAVSVDSDAGDLIILDGTALDDGDKITSGGTAGEIAVLTYYDATGWYAATDGWTDGGP